MKIDFNSWFLSVEHGAVLYGAKGNIIGRHAAHPAARRCDQHAPIIYAPGHVAAAAPHQSPAGRGMAGFQKLTLTFLQTVLHIVPMKRGHGARSAVTLLKQHGP